MAERAIEFLSRIRQRVSHVQFVLLRVEEGVVIVTLREIALRRPRDQTLLGVVADGAG